MAILLWISTPISFDANLWPRIYRQNLRIREEHYRQKNLNNLPNSSTGQMVYSTMGNTLRCTQFSCTHSGLLGARWICRWISYLKRPGPDGLYSRTRKHPKGYTTCTHSGPQQSKFWLMDYLEDRWSTISKQPKGFITCTHMQRE